MTETVKTCLSCGRELPHDAVACPACGAELGRPAPPAKKSAKLPWVGLGCLAVFILLAAAAILIPGTLTSPKRIRQNAQVAQVRTIATMVLSYQTDHRKSPIPPGAGTGQGWRFVPMSDMKPVLVPIYGSELPEKDTGGHPYWYGYREEAPEDFCVIATGSDGRRDSDALPVSPVKTHCWENDVIWLNVEFLQVPEGRQHACK
jgi:type II secretory pathway pseudopilin PulG